MGVKISIDKHVSELDDILDMSPNYLSKVQFESKISPDIKQHLKVSLVLINHVTDLAILRVQEDIRLSEERACHVA